MKRTTTDEILKHAMDNYNKVLMEKVAIRIEKSRNIHLKRNEYNEGDVVILPYNPLYKPQ